MNLCNAIITSKVAPALKWLWYHCVPSFIIWRTVFGLKVAFDSRDNPFVWFERRKRIENCEGVGVFLKCLKKGTFWDLGCNVGIYSLYAASLGWKVVAVDLSPKCIRLLISSVIKNHLAGRVIAIARAISVRTRTYCAPKTATAGNNIDSVFDGDMVASMTWKELAERFGVPSLIKMDIEGGEVEFLKDEEFLSWLAKNEIVLLVELHDLRYEKLLSHLQKVRKLSAHNFAIEMAKSPVQKMDETEKQRCLI